ncbi:MAG TPA: ABC transporter ATP-binding protein [Candidatus Saccharimonadales bacterium]
MGEELAIVVKDLYKTFKLPHEQHSGLKQAILSIFKGGRGYETQKVLNDINFEIHKGEFFGIVGRNGSGKSTLLKLLAGVYTPDKGLIQLNGSLTPFIELGVGFNPELTGRENVFMNGALLGFDNKEMETMYDDIVEFAELEKFMDQKLKNYSSGMQVRLAFSIAIRAKSDILLLDEVLAVGDAIFQKKCYEYFKQLKKEKKTVVFVSHDTSALQEYCDRGVLLENGKLLKIDKIDAIIDEYIDILNTTESNDVAAKDEAGVHHIGTGGIKITNADILNGRNGLLTEEDETLEIEVEHYAKESIDDPIYGVTIYDSSGQRIFVANNMWSQKKVPTVTSGEKIVVSWSVPNIFNSGSYSVTPAVAASSGAVVLDQVENIMSFKVRKRQISNAYTNLDYKMKVRSK